MVNPLAEAPLRDERLEISDLFFENFSLSHYATCNYWRAGASHWEEVMSRPVEQVNKFHAHTTVLFLDLLPIFLLHVCKYHYSLHTKV